jgi:hypothetical protein
MRKTILLFVIFLMSSSTFWAQSLVNTGKLLQGGVDDGVKMVNAYITPLNRSIMVGMNNSNFSTLYNDDNSKRFSISLTASFISIPKEDQSFDVNTLGLKHIAAEPGNSIAQTVFGDSSTVTIYSRDSIPDKSQIPGGGDDDGGGGFPLKAVNGIDSVASFTFNSISGSDIHTLPLATLRFAYKFNFGNLSAQVLPYFSSNTTVFSWGLNWQQDLAFFLPPLRDKKLKITAGLGYYNFYLRNHLEVTPDGVTVPYGLDGEAAGPYDNQELKMNYSSIHVNGTVIYSIKNITFWGGLGYNMGFSNVKILGTYPIYGSARTPAGEVSVSVKDIDDPMDESVSYSRVKGFLGLRYDFEMLYLQANYTIGNYGGIGATIGIKI